MTQRPIHVPKFGNWDANEHVPFTAVFDNARAGKGGGKNFNPNDPSENPSLFGLGGDDMLGPTENAEETVPYPPPRHERKASREESDHKRPPREQNAGFPTRRASGDAPGYRRTGGKQTNPDGSRGGSSGASREDNGTELGGMENQRVDQSPNNLGPYHGRLGNRPPAAPSAWERKAPAEGGTAHGTAAPGKNRLRPGPARGDETPDRGPALPKFGAWDEKDPSSGEGFTVIFNQARNEKKIGTPVRIPPLQADSSAGMDPHHPQSTYAPQKKSRNWFCCFQ